MKNLKHLNQNNYIEKLEDELSNHFNKKIKVEYKFWAMILKHRPSSSKKK